MTILSIAIIVTALGIVGITSSLSSVKYAHAVSCKNEPGPSCNGSASAGPGDFHTHFKCRHLAR